MIHSYEGRVGEIVSLAGVGFMLPRTIPKPIGPVIPFNDAHVVDVVLSENKKSSSSCSTNRTKKRLHQPSLPGIISNWQQEQILLDGVEIKLTIPADPDELLQIVEQSEGVKRENFDPYWGHLWPAARKMAKLVTQFNWKPGTRVLELGCGSGLLGIAALATGMRVTFSDNQPEALQLSACNAMQNGFQTFEVLLLDWFAPPAIDPFPIVIASDILYEERFHEPLLFLFQKVITQEGEVWIADPGRGLLATFVRTAQNHNFQIAIYDEKLETKSFPGIGHFQLVLLKKESSSGNSLLQR